MRGLPPVLGLRQVASALRGGRRLQRRRRHPDVLLTVGQQSGIRLTDSTLRDGSNAIRHVFTPEQVAVIARGLDRAGMHTISVGHGEGLGASSLQYGQGLYPDDDLVAAAAAAIERADIAVIMLPGIGTKRHIESARERGATMARVSTHCTEAD